MASEPTDVTDPLIVRITRIVSRSRGRMDHGMFKLIFDAHKDERGFDVHVGCPNGCGYEYRVEHDYVYETDSVVLTVKRESGGLQRDVASFPAHTIPDATHGLRLVLRSIVDNAQKRYTELLRKIAIENATKVRKPPAPPMKGHTAPYKQRQRNC